MTTSTRTDLYTRVTDRIIADLEQGARPWMKPWHSTDAEGRISLPLRHNGAPYRGINILLLWGESLDKGYARSTWMTYKQAAELNAQVKKGEHGALVVYAGRISKTETTHDGEDLEREVPFLKGYTVFNVEQIDGLPDHYYTKPEPRDEPLQLLEASERFFASTGATFRHGGNMAYYAPGPDLIQLPVPDAFRDAESYAATKAHELVHWTKHERRLNREFGRKRFGDTAYAREELVAELGAAFLCASLGITAEPRDDHTAYLGHWLKMLKDDKRAIFSAAAYAQRAVDYVHSLQVDHG
ncbi:MAG TPA: zincin-like metallopeptidase domain-containing protein [Burkholderiales bacterium]|nr:zincin-like metallopeptidase domain-containing protein [Burkholderiales bacterium]